MVWFVIRFSSGRITTTFDEAYYLSTLRIGGVYSGMITPCVLRAVNAIISNPVISLLLVSLGLFIVYPFLLLRFHKSFSGYSSMSFPFFLALLLSSHLLWSSNEVRPQQIGTLVGLALLLFILRVHEEDLPRFKVLLGIPVLWVLLGLAHILSFAVFLALVWFVGVLELIRGRPLKVYLLSLVPSFFALFLLFMPGYETMVFSIKWMFKHSTNTLFHFLGWNFYSSLLLGWLFLLVSGPIVASLWRRTPTFSLILERIRGEVVKRPGLYTLLGTLAMLALMILQFYLGRNVYELVYRSPNFIVIMQAGNFLFGILTIAGFIGSLNEKRSDFSREILVFMVVLMVFALLVSTVMPASFGSFGFRNWMIRMYQYFVVFSLPFVAREIEALLGSLQWRRAFVFILVFGITASVLNVSRPPIAYNYPYYWTGRDLELLSQVGPGFVYKGDTLTPPENSLALSFLGWAYGNRIEPYPGNVEPLPESDLCVSDLCHSPYPYREIPLTSVNLSRATIVTGNIPPDLVSWIRSLFHIRGEGDPVLALGNSTLNPLISKLESQYFLPVVVNYSVITGPHFRYYFAIREGRIKGDVDRSMFVVQAVLVNDTPVIVISSPSLDGVAAGLWLLKNEILRNRTKWGNVSFVVGEWDEMDGRVLPIVRAYPGDKNGFSYGDRVKILRIGTVGKP